MINDYEEALFLRRNTRFTTGMKKMGIMSEVAELIGDKIRQARKKKGLTLKELGERLGFSESLMSRYEKGKVNLTLEALQRIALELDAKLEINLDVD